MRDEEDNDRMMLAAAAIARIAAALPLEEAVPVLMVVVTELIRTAPNAAAHWDAVLWGVQAHRSLQDRVVLHEGSDTVN